MYPVTPALFEVLVWTGLSLVGLRIGILFLRKLRAAPEKQESTAGELLSKFHELHSEGELSDAEYRTITTQLAARLQQELKGNVEKG